VRRNTGERTIRRTLEPTHFRIAPAQRGEDPLDVFNLDAEMIQTRGTSGAARVDVQAEVSVADGHRAFGFRPG
jgi:hypothetical protein